jgi:hypothetical protein
MRMTDPILPHRPQVPVLTLTLNPALDMATDVPRLVPDEKLRCSDPSLDPGGGGINVARAIHALGGEALALVALGGLTGDRLADLLRADGVTFLGISGPGETRQSLTVTESATGRQFRFMMPLRDAANRSTRVSPRPPPIPPPARGRCRSTRPRPMSSAMPITRPNSSTCRRWAISIRA